MENKKKMQNVLPEKKEKKIQVLDLFCGCGGASAGLEESGMEIVAGVDHTRGVLRTFKHNHPEAETICCDLSDKEEQKKLQRFRGDIDLVVGGPPCVAFSRSGKNIAGDPRSYLWEDFLRIVNLVRPKIFVMENVSTFPTSYYCDLEDERIARLTKTSTKENKGEIKNLSRKNLVVFTEKVAAIKYEMCSKIMDCSLFDVPQKRKRFICIAWDPTRIQSRLTFPPASKNPAKTVEESLNDISDLKKTKHLNNHKPNATRPETLTRIRDVLPGKGLYKSTKAYYRPYPDKISRTVVSSSNSPFIHYREHRMMTNRERARLQGFKDKFLFLGTALENSKMIGNAAPPPLMFHIGQHIISQAF